MPPAVMSVEVIFFIIASHLGTLIISSNSYAPTAYFLVSHFFAAWSESATMGNWLKSIEPLVGDENKVLIES